MCRRVWWVLQCVATCCDVLRCVAVCGECFENHAVGCVVVYRMVWWVLQRVAVRCGLRRVIQREECFKLHSGKGGYECVWISVMQCATVYFSLPSDVSRRRSLVRWVECHSNDKNGYVEKSAQKHHPWTHNQCSSKIRISRPQDISLYSWIFMCSIYLFWPCTWRFIFC